MQKAELAADIRALHETQQIYRPREGKARLGQGEKASCVTREKQAGRER